MRPLALSEVRSVVTVAAHPDDVEIGAGGLLLHLATATPGLRVHYVVATGTDKRQAEARDACAAFLPGARMTFALHDLPDGHLPAHTAQVKAILRAAAADGVPDLVLAPSQDDAHQDHRLLAGMVATEFRDSMILHYEIAKWDGDLGRRNVYVPMSAELARRKVELLQASFPSQHGRDWWDEEVFLGLARLRGVECRSRYAEAFDCRKMVLLCDE